MRVSEGSSRLFTTTCCFVFSCRRGRTAVLGRSRRGRLLSGQLHLFFFALLLAWRAVGASQACRCRAEPRAPHPGRWPHARPAKAPRHALPCRPRRPQRSRGRVRGSDCRLSRCHSPAPGSRRPDLRRSSSARRRPSRVSTNSSLEPPLPLSRARRRGGVGGRPSAACATAGRQREHGAGRTQHRLGRQA